MDALHKLHLLLMKGLRIILGQLILRRFDAPVEIWAVGPNSKNQMETLESLKSLKMADNPHDVLLTTRRSFI